MILKYLSRYFFFMFDNCFMQLYNKVVKCFHYKKKFLLFLRIYIIGG